MHKPPNTIRQRINITLPEKTLGLIDRITEKGDRSRFIDRAVQHYIHEVGRTKLRTQLKEGAMHRSVRDLQYAEEWFILDEEIWKQKHA